MQIITEHFDCIRRSFSAYVKTSADKKRRRIKKKSRFNRDLNNNYAKAIRLNPVTVKPF